MMQSSIVRKFWQGTSTSTYAATTTYTDLSAITLGTDNNARTGMEVKLIRLELDMLFVIADTTNFVRFFIFEWFPSDSSDVPSGSELYSTAYSAGNNEHYCLHNPLRPSRFRILHERTVALDVAHVVKHLNVNLKLGSSLSFDNGVTTGKNHIYIAIVSDSTTVTHPTVAYTWTLTFDE